MQPKIFGPAPTVAIFAEKWSAKLCKVSDDYVNSGYANSTDFCSKAFDHVLAFNAEAEWLGLTPDSDLGINSDVTFGRPQNPFEMAKELKAGINPILLNWQKLKAGEVIGGQQWHKLSSSYKAEAEVILAKVKEAEEAELWKVDFDQESVQHMLKSVGSELRNTLGTQAVAKVEAMMRDLAGPKDENDTEPDYSRRGVPKWH